RASRKAPGKIRLRVAHVIIQPPRLQRIVDSSASLSVGHPCAIREMTWSQQGLIKNKRREPPRMAALVALTTHVPSGVSVRMRAPERVNVYKTKHYRRVRGKVERRRGPNDLTHVADPVNRAIIPDAVEPDDPVGAEVNVNVVRQAGNSVIDRG